MKTARLVLVLSTIVCCWTSQAQKAGKFADTPEVEVKAFYMSISKKIAAEWGLDGGPAIAPDKTPLGKAIPNTLSAEETQKLVTGLRKTEGAQVLASTSVTTASGNTATSRNVREVMLPSSYTDAGEPVFDSATDIGITLRVMPTVQPESGLVSLELSPELNRLVGYTLFGQRRMPAVSSCTLEAKFTVNAGSTRILTASSPVAQAGGPVTLLSPEEATRVNDYVTVLFITVNFVAD